MRHGNPRSDTPEHAPLGPSVHLPPLEEVEWVCVDLFDTLVVRSCHPEDVKRLACERLARVRVPWMSGDALYRLRAAAEQELSNQNVAAGHDREFSLRVCLELVSTRLAKLDEPARVAFVESAMGIELAVEQAVQEPVPAVVAFVASLAQQHKRVALVSDFYLPAAEIRRMLRHHGLHDYFGHIFSSADDLKTKRTGHKYPIVARALGCPPGQILMLGDDQVADVDNARAHGFQAWHIDRREQHVAYSQMARVSGDRKSIAKAIDEVLLGDQEAVFPEMALTLFCFIERLYEALLVKGARDVFFVSREGQPLKRLFDSYQSRRAPPESVFVRSHYLEASRRSLFLPSLGPLEQEQFELLFRQYRNISWGDFLRSLGMSDIIADLEAAVDVDPQVRSTDFPASTAFHALRHNDLFRRRYETDRLASRKALFSYLAQFPVAFGSERMVLVDVGWKGTMQDSLARLLSPDGSRQGLIDGLYVGLLDAGEATHTSRKAGLLFSAVGARTPWFHVFDENRSLFELMLAADHASIATYRMNDGRGVAVLDSFPEERLLVRQVLPAQRAIEERFHRLDSLLMRRRYTPSWLLKSTARRHARMAFGATKHEMDWFGHVYHMENFGIYEKTLYAGPQSQSGGQIRFFASMMRKSARQELGLWPWLSIVQQGGRSAGFAYRIARQLRSIQPR